MSSPRQNLIPGTLNLLVLSAVRSGTIHGYGISQWIAERTSNVLRAEEGVLYPALHRLEKEGHLLSEWGRNDTGRRAKFYSLTPSGRQRLAEEVERWQLTSNAVNVAVAPGSE